MRRLSVEGKISLRVYHAHDLEEAIAWLPRLEAMRVRKYPGSSLPRGYLERLLRLGVHDGPVHCSALLVGERDVSWHVGFCHKGTLFWYIPTYDPDYAVYSPGKIHVYSTMEWAFNHGCHTFDFLRGEEAYKFGWADRDEFQMHGMLWESRKASSVIRKSAARVINKLKRFKAVLNAG